MYMTGGVQSWDKLDSTAILTHVESKSDLPDKYVAQ